MVFCRYYVIRILRYRQITVRRVCWTRLLQSTNRLLNQGTLLERAQSCFSISKYHVLVSMILFPGSERWKSIMTDYTKKHEPFPRKGRSIIVHFLEPCFFGVLMKNHDHNSHFTRKWRFCETVKNSFSLWWRSGALAVTRSGYLDRYQAPSWLDDLNYRGRTNQSKLL